MAEFPALPLFTDAWVADTKHLTYAHRGLYHDLLVLMWRSPQCRVPRAIEWIITRLGIEKDHAAIATLRSIIKEFCTGDGNWIWQKRLRKEYLYVKASTKKRSAAAKARWAQKVTKGQAQADFWTDQSNALKTPEIDGYNAYAPTPTPTPTPIGSRVLPSLDSLHSSESPPSERALLAPKALDRAMEDEAVRRWNETAKAHGLSAVAKLSDQRRRKLRLRLQELDGIDGWQSMLGKIAASSFMRGSGDKGWVVDFEFLLSPTNLTKVMEGRYDDRRQRPRAGSASDTFAKLREQLGKSRASNGDGQQHSAKVSKFRPRIA